ncbi:3-hydroxyacyl-ACP dehydratase FabZ family protein [Aporhodopirellula aestuarii]|uniref:Beta-hydroxyacyl-ACP dehydratase n=1 Tax=Aporhodopirellula aestuarii TaxID=2950107 RepID=A0ABT0U3D2_9BACT|nr:3-hydroxyacyl-ACP dehydratase FabZ family protein [Aporhodopirellula aestuarii]MCM2371414.1 beta-hydroxyacyl-ACP dehydratase [Aporhodopirellula aestuarii]
MSPSDTPASASPLMGAEQIEAMIPHRSPMRLLDEVVEMTETTLHARKTFSEDEFFVQGHFPGYPLVPGVIQCECCLQAGAILLREHTPEVGEFVPVATRMDSVKFKNMVRPGDTVDIHVTLKERLANAFFLTGKMLLNGKTTTRLEFACSITSPKGDAS